MKVKINKKEYEASEDETILDVCRRENIKIPTLCAHGKLKREAICRLCLVETNLTDKLIPSCAFKVCEKLEVITESKKIKKAREINMELLWSDHAGKCVKCVKNKQCELQNLAEEYKIENFHFVPRKEDITDTEERDLLKDNRIRVVVDDKNPVIYRTTEYCVECRRCVNICPVKSYGFNHRAGDVVVGTPYEEPLDCIFCGACVKHCPTAALTDQGSLDEIIKDLDDINILSVAIVDPVILISSEQKFEPINSPNKLSGLLRELGFERVFDLSWGMEKFLERTLNDLNPKKALFKSPKRKMSKLKISSFCPSVELYINKYFPEFSDNISKVERPEEIMAEAIKNEYAKQEKIDAGSISTVLISSCTARKKLKSQALNYIITARELEQLALKKELDLKNIKEFQVDSFLDKHSEILENIVEFGKLSEIIKKRAENSLIIAKANGVEDIKKTLDLVRKREMGIDFLEAMICPEGCINGGGQFIKLE